MPGINWRRLLPSVSSTHSSDTESESSSITPPQQQRNGFAGGRRASFYGGANTFLRDTIGFRIRKRIYKIEKVLGPIMSRLVPNFIAAHYVYITFMVILASVLIYPQKNIQYIDALFFASGSSTQAGLNTVDTNNLTLFQQMVMYIICMLSTPIFIHSGLAFLRLWQFEKSFDDIKEKSKLNFKMRRTATLAAMRSFTMDQARTESNVSNGEQHRYARRPSTIRFQKTQTSTNNPNQRRKGNANGYGTHNGSEDLVRRLNRYQKDSQLVRNIDDIDEEAEVGGIIGGSSTPRNEDGDSYNNVAHFSEPSDSDSEVENDRNFNIIDDDGDDQGIDSTPKDSNAKDIKFANLPIPPKRASVAPRDLYMSISMMQQQQKNTGQDLDNAESGPALKIKGPVERLIEKSQSASGKSLKHRRDQKKKELKRRHRLLNGIGGITDSREVTPSSDSDNNRNNNEISPPNVNIQFEEPVHPRRRPQPPTFTLGSAKVEKAGPTSPIEHSTSSSATQATAIADDNDFEENISDLSAEFDSDIGSEVEENDNETDDGEPEADDTSNSFGNMVGKTRSHVVTNSTTKEQPPKLQRAVTVDVDASKTQKGTTPGGPHHHTPAGPALIKSMTFDKMIKNKMSKRKGKNTGLTRRITRTISGPGWLRNRNNTREVNEANSHGYDSDNTSSSNDEDEDDDDDVISDFSNQYRMPTNYLSWTPTVGRNSTFVVLSDEQKEELGGVEYRALKLLGKILIFYYVGFHLMAIVMLLPYILVNHTNYVTLLRSDGVSPTWWGFFTSASAFNDLGFTLTPDSMMSFNDNPYILLVMSFFIVIGNSGFPIFLRFVIWIFFKFTKPLTQRKESLQFLLDHPRRCFTMLFPSGPTWWLFFVLIVLTAYDWFLFLILDFHDSDLASVGPGYRTIDGLFQAFSTRTAGFNVVNIGTLHPAIQVSYLVMMYISVLPLAISIRRTNVYEEQSLGIYLNPTEDNPSENKNTMSFIGTHLRKQLSFDLWFIFLGLFIICIVEKDRLEAGDLNFSIFSCLFEIVSAYGTVGLSLGYPTLNSSFSGEFRIISKLVVIAMMIRGRHRGLPYNIDRAIMLSTDKIRLRDDYQTHQHMRRTNTLAPDSTTNTTSGLPRTGTAGGERFRHNSTFDSRFSEPANMNDFPLEQTFGKIFRKASQGAHYLKDKLNDRIHSTDHRVLPSVFTSESIFNHDYTVNSPITTRDKQNFDTEPSNDVTMENMDGRTAHDYAPSEPVPDPVFVEGSPKVTEANVRENICDTSSSSDKNHDQQIHVSQTPRVQRSSSFS